MVNNPVSAGFISPDHNALQPNGQPKITLYRVSVFEINDPSGVPIFTTALSKNDGRITNNSGDSYNFDIVGLLPPNSFGWFFIRGERDGAAGEDVGDYGAGIQFQIGLTDIATVNVFEMEE